MKRRIRFWAGLAALLAMATSMLLAQGKLASKVQLARQEHAASPTAPPQNRLAMQIFGDARTAWLGVKLEDVSADDVKELKLPGAYGAKISEVEPNSPASKAGLQANDVIVEFDGERVRSVAELRRLIRETPAGRTVSVRVVRDGKDQSVRATLEERRGEGFGITMPPPSDYRVEPVPPLRMPDLYFFGGPRLGVSVSSLTPQLAEYFGVKEGKGVLVREVTKDSPAEKAGVKAGDVIVKVDNREVSSPGDLRSALNAVRDKHQVTLTIVRNRQEQTLKVELPSSSGHGTETSAEDWLTPAADELAELEDEIAQVASREANRQELQKKIRELQRQAHDLQQKLREEALTKQRLWQKQMRELADQLRRELERAGEAAQVV